VGMVLVALVACSGDRREAASLVSAIDRFHTAENPEKPGVADYAATVACSAHDVCAAKDACLKAIQDTAKGLRLKSEVSQGLAELEAKKLTPQDEAAKALPAKLEEAARLLDQGHAAMPACDARILELRQAYHL
jgi:hypothetical protein